MEAAAGEAKVAEWRQEGGPHLMQLVAAWPPLAIYGLWETLVLVVERPGKIIFSNYKLKC